MLYKLYWLVKPDFYGKINEILGSNFSEYQITMFIETYDTGIYISYDGDGEVEYDYTKWGFMPYMYYLDYNDNSTQKASKNWYNERNYIYKGDISRIIKLKRLNDIQRKKAGSTNA